ncbi:MULTISPECIES: hypothetical protein [Streptomyces]|uniref:hypothetical protein n=1 Tax=Streptomyces TaxID=1883 RepID=UPI001C301319|nr:hypothetical protein [Streptomyces sp. GbtcB7]
MELSTLVSSFVFRLWPGQRIRVVEFASRLPTGQSTGDVVERMNPFALGRCAVPDDSRTIRILAQVETMQILQGPEDQRSETAFFLAFYP